MDCSTAGFPVHHQLLKLAQTHVHWVGDAIQPSHPLSSPSPPIFNLFQHQGLFQWVSCLHQVAKVLAFQLQHQSFQWIFRTDYLWDLLVWFPCYPRDSQESSLTPQFRSIHSLALTFLMIQLSCCLLSKYQTSPNPVLKGCTGQVSCDIEASCNPYLVQCGTSMELSGWLFSFPSASF